MEPSQLTEEQLEDMKDDAREEGRSEGRIEGRSEGEIIKVISQICRKLVKGKDMEVLLPLRI